MSRHNEFTLADFVAQLAQVSSLGWTGRFMARRLGVPDAISNAGVSVDEVHAQWRRMRGMFDAMTAAEREDPGEIDADRRRRIARGAGVRVTEISQFIRQFEMSRDMMRGLRELGWRQKVGAVLGLVTGRPFQRDPSHVHPIPSPGAWLPFEVAATVLSLCACALAAAAYAVLRHG
jgi:signal recognition particle GTPase